ncbi:hypothetical protein SGR_166 [Streptomyces griseus subsp. griseus NBRC 13350]|uniref:Uncharacterized protein n=1 Tax=Streptomyces griseus subsp. griseus (strain JCM 4626 / CBS 651.72 / NBRC 13350 / KCC S-0626 / ISP 5235) TaxID=455632 RepID=B1VNH2_STRGG|nr:hypothetical protein SGR_166 [Streptomyces griseus subsp. griseus NBRC 13350]
MLQSSLPRMPESCLRSAGLRAWKVPSRNSGTASSAWARSCRPGSVMVTAYARRSAASRSRRTWPACSRLSQMPTITLRSMRSSSLRTRCELGPTSASIFSTRCWPTPSPSAPALASAARATAAEARHRAMSKRSAASRGK